LKLVGVAHASYRHELLGPFARFGGTEPTHPRPFWERP
jgi:hypothetical protein